jgi:hypothetical protein
MVKQSHLALLLAPNQPYQIPAKVYDYMGAGTKILALADEGATCDLIRSTGIGGVFHPSDIVGIKNFITQSLSAGAVFGTSLKTEAVNQFNVAAITRSLVDYLDQICLKAEVTREESKGS